jgi:hypothetical protein
MPPAFASSSTSNGKELGTAAATEEVLPPTTLSSMVSTPLLTTPPPSVKRPFGELTAARLPVTTLRINVTAPSPPLLMPPPNA